MKWGGSRWKIKRKWGGSEGEMDEEGRKWGEMNRKWGGSGVEQEVECRDEEVKRKWMK